MLILIGAVFSYGNPNLALFSDTVPTVLSCHTAPRRVQHLYCTPFQQQTCNTFGIWSIFYSTGYKKEMGVTTL